MKVQNQYLKILEYLHLSFNKRTSIQYTFWVQYILFFETTIMAMVHKTMIDTLHKEGKSQRVITEMGGRSRSAV